MKKQKDGYYYEKKVEWKFADYYGLYVTGFFFSILNLICLMYLMTFVNKDGLFGLVLGVPLALTVFLMIFCIICIFDNVPKKKVKFKRIGK